MSESKDIHATTSPRAAGAGSRRSVPIWWKRYSRKGCRYPVAHEHAGGFDYPGCAWPDSGHSSSFAFCENGGKAIAWETTAKRCTPESFAVHMVTELSGRSDYELEMAGSPIPWPMTPPPTIMCR